MGLEEACRHDKSIHLTRDSPGTVHDAVQPVCNSEDSAVRELFANGVLYQVVCLQVYSCCGFIQN